MPKSRLSRAGAVGAQAPDIERPMDIERINQISSSIASAVEEQEAVTRDMSANMQTAAIGVETITQGMKDIAASTQLIEEATRKVKDASRALV